MFVKRNSLGYFPEFRSQSLKTSLSADRQACLPLPAGRRGQAGMN